MAQRSTASASTAAPGVAAGRPARAAARGRPRKRAEGLDLREALLDAAEREFALHGFDGVTTRRLAQTAGVDAALLHYYFATKRGLFDAVFARRADVINRERMASMDAYEAACAAAGERPTVLGAVDAFIAPLLARSRTGGPGWKHYLALVAQVSATPTWGGQAMHHMFDPVVLRLVALLRLALPTADDRDLFWGYQFLTGSMMLAVSETGRIDLLSDGLCLASDLDAVDARLAAYCAAGIESLVARRAG